MDSLLFYGLGLLAIVVIGKILLFPLKLIWKFVSNAVLGGILLLAVNFIGQYGGFFIEITPIKALIVGVLGIPGILLAALI